MSRPAENDPLSALGGGTWWENPQIQSELNLTANQVSQIQKLVRSKREALIDLKGTMEKKLLLFVDEFQREDFDLQRARTAAEEFHKVRSELERTRMMDLLELRSILNHEQYYKLKTKWQKSRKRLLRKRQDDMRGAPRGKTN